MNVFNAQLWDADRLVFGEVTGDFDPDGSTGRFEVHEGGLLGGGLDPLPERVYRLVFGDATERQIHLTKVHASDSAGIARGEFRVVSPADDADAPPTKTFP